MPAPWVLFDRVDTYGGDCTRGADPDIAGLGVVLSFVAASIITTTASILAMALDQNYDRKGRFTFRAPMQFIRETFIDTDWKREYAWRPFLDPLIIGLGDQQLVTGYAVLLSGWIKVGQNSIEVQGAHFVLILYICVLSSSSHLAALITLRKYFDNYRLIAKVRLTLVIIFTLFLFSSMVVTISISNATHQHYNGTAGKQSSIRRLAFVVPMFFIIAGFSSALVCIVWNPRRRLRHKHLEPRLRPVGLKSWPIAVPAKLGLELFNNLFLNPLIVFVIQIILAVLSVVLVLSQKLSAPDDPGKWCSLHDYGDNTWGFGQTLSIAMLLLPAMSATQTYLEARRHIHKERGP